MGERITELTNDLDRKSGRRRFQIGGLDDAERVIIEMAWQVDAALPGDQPSWADMDHPPVNQRATEDVLDLLCALRAKPFAVDLTA